MKLSKSLILGTAIALTMIPLSLSAMDAEQLEKKILAARACPAPQIVEQEVPAAQGWFSSFRQNLGNVLRKAGDELRTEGDKSAVGRMKEVAKDGFFAAASAKVGVSLVSFKDAFCNFGGNILRTVGQWIKGGEATQTTTRVILDNMGLSKGGSSDDMLAYSLKVAAKANLKTGETTTLTSVADGIVKRGYASKAQMERIDENLITFQAYAEDAISKNMTLSLQDFTQSMMNKESSYHALSNIKAIKAASMLEQQSLIKQYIAKTYEKVLREENVKAKRTAAPAA